jgi:hypothetical protein
MADESGENRGLWRVSKYREEAARDAARQYAEDSRARLARNIETKIRTTMIGALSAVEQRLGHLWGLGKPREHLTEAERRMEAVKQDLRTDILNLGNNQLRAAMSEIGQYDVAWRRYEYSLVPGEAFGGDGGVDRDGSTKTNRGRTR